MAYLVSQLRKIGTGTKTYMEPVEGLSGSQINTPNIFGDSSSEGRFFTDFAIAGTFQQKKVYYLRFKVRKIPQYFYSGMVQGRTSSYYDADFLNLQILLKNNGQDDEEEIPPETVGTCFVPTTSNYDTPEYSSYSFVFTPSKTFDRLGFRIGRVSFDAIERKNFNNPRNWLLDTESITRLCYQSDVDTQGIEITVSGPRIIWYDSNEADADLCSLVNIIPSEQQSNGWLKFGYQSRPGSLIVVNKEPIRVGRSGIYEINNGTIIKEFMIANPGGWDNSKIDAFLLDYAYKS